MKKNITKYKYAVIATDTIIFTVSDNKLKILLIKMKKEPFIGSWAAPGGLIKADESIVKAAKRNLLEKTGVKDVYLEQLYTFGKVNRDPAGRVVSVAYFALIPTDSKLKISDQAEWFSIKNLPKLAYDHKEVISNAIDRLRFKLESSNIVYNLLPKEFTLSEMQNIYEIILGKKLDKRNFRKKILSLDLIRKTGGQIAGKAHRPAAVYKFIKKSPQVVGIL